MYPAVEPLVPLVTSPPDAKLMPTLALPTLSTVPRLVKVHATPLVPIIPAALVELTSITPVEVTVVGLIVRV